MFTAATSLSGLFIRRGIFYIVFTLLFLLLFALPLSATAKKARQSSIPDRNFFTDDQMVTAALLQIGWHRLSKDNADDGLRLHCRAQARYIRQPNWWAFAFLAIGLFPISVEATVDYQLQCSFILDDQSQRIQAKNIKAETYTP